MNNAKEQLRKLKEKKEKEEKVVKELYDTVPLNHNITTIESMTKKSKEEIEKIILEAQKARKKIEVENKEFLLENRDESNELMQEINDLFDDTTGNLKSFVTELTKTNDRLEEQVIREREKKPLLVKLFQKIKG